MTLKIGLLGAGRFGQFHLSGYAKNKNCEIVSVASRTEESAKRVANKFNIPNVYWGDSWKEMFKEQNLDVVSICSPNYLHGPMTIAALENDCNVLCEKPIAISLEELSQIERTLNKKKLIYFSSFQKRYLRISPVIKKIIENKVFGEPHLIRYFFGHYGPYTSYNAMSEQKWFMDSKMAGGGVLIDLGVHCIDLLRYLAGEFTEIEGYSHNSACKGIIDEDICNVLFRFENNILGNISVSWCSEPMEIIEIFGSKGTLAIDLQSNKPFNYKPSRLKRDPILKEAVNDTYNTASIPQHDLINHFIDCVINKKQDEPNFNDGKRAVEFVLKAYNFKKN